MDSKLTWPQEVALLIPGFLDRRSEDVFKLRQFIENSDYGQIKYLAHKIKGNGAAFGFPTLSQTAAELEKAADDKNETQTRILIESLSQIVLEIKRGQS